MKQTQLQPPEEKQLPLTWEFIISFLYTRTEIQQILGNHNPYFDQVKLEDKFLQQISNGTFLQTKRNRNDIRRRLRQCGLSDDLNAITMARPFADAKLKTNADATDDSNKKRDLDQCQLPTEQLKKKAKTCCTTGTTVVTPPFTVWNHPTQTPLPQSSWTNGMVIISPSQKSIGGKGYQSFVPMTTIGVAPTNIWDSGRISRSSPSSSPSSSSSSSLPTFTTDSPQEKASISTNDVTIMKQEKKVLDESSFSSPVSVEDPHLSEVGNVIPNENSTGILPLATLTNDYDHDYHSGSLSMHNIENYTDTIPDTNNVILSRQPEEQNPMMVVVVQNDHSQQDHDSVITVVPGPITVTELSRLQDKRITYKGWISIILWMLMFLVVVMWGLSLVRNVRNDGSLEVLDGRLFHIPTKNYIGIGDHDFGMDTLSKYSLSPDGKWLGTEHSTTPIFTRSGHRRRPSIHEMGCQRSSLISTTGGDIATSCRTLEPSVFMLECMNEIHPNQVLTTDDP